MVRLKRQAYLVRYVHAVMAQESDRIHDTPGGLCRNLRSRADWRLARLQSTLRSIRCGRGLGPSVQLGMLILLFAEEFMHSCISECLVYVCTQVFIKSNHPSALSTRSSICYYHSLAWFYLLTCFLRSHLQYVVNSCSQENCTI